MECLISHVSCCAGGDLHSACIPCTLFWCALLSLDLFHFDYFFQSTVKMKGILQELFIIR